MPENRLFFQGAILRPRDELRDILEAEYGHDEHDRVMHYIHDYATIRNGWDESQSIEIIAVEPGWLYGEKFYEINIPTKDKLEEDDYQYFQLNVPKADSPAVPEESPAAPTGEWIFIKIKRTP